MSDARLKDIPKLNRDAGNLPAVLDALREAVQTFRGIRGDDLDRALTLRDFKGGVLSGLLTGGGTVIVGGGSGGSGGSGGATPDPTPPPTPTGFEVSAGLSFIAITHDTPTYTQGHGHDRTLVYGAQWPLTTSTAPTFSSAVPLGTFQGTFGVVPANPGTRWCLWIKWQSVDGYASVDPAGGTNGKQATTAYDPTVLLTALVGQITRSQLYSDIGTPIDLITAPATTAGSVNARIKVETDARILDITNEITARSNGDTTTYNNAKAYTDGYTYSTAGVDSAIAAKADILRAEFATGDTTTYNSAKSYAETWAYSRSQADAAIAASASTLATNYAASDATTLTSAQTYTQTYAYSKSASDSALATLNTSIRTDFAAADATTLASAQSFTYSRSAIDGSISSMATTLRGEFAAADGTTLTSAQNYVNANAYAKSTGEALASTVSTLSTSINTPTSGNNPTYAALQTEASTRATQTGELYAQYTVKVDVNGYVSGFGLASTANSATPTSSFIVRADKFAISSPSGPGISPITPFVVNTVSQTENGVTIPPGVYMDGAYIRNLTAGIARLGNAWVDDAKIANLSAAKLTVGDGTVGGNLKSSSFGYGSGGTAGAGWLLTPGGSAYLNNAVVYGTIYAGSGVFGGSLSAATGTFAGSLSAASGTFTGSLSGATGTFAGSLSAATGTFAGDLSAAGGSFAGNLSAAGGSFVGTVQVGSSPTVSGSTMTGTGAVLNPSGTFAFGTSSKNLSFDGSTLTANGISIVAAQFDAFSAAITGSWPNYSVSVSGGRPGYQYVWIIQQSTGSLIGTVYMAGGITSSSCTAGFEPGNGAGSGTGTLTVLVKDSNGRTTYASHPFNYFSSGSGGGGTSD